jgi:hypothetical protein
MGKVLIGPNSSLGNIEGSELSQWFLMSLGKASPTSKKIKLKQI